MNEKWKIEVIIITYSIPQIKLTLTSVLKSLIVKLEIPDITKFEKTPLIRIFPALLSKPIESIFSGSPGGKPSSGAPTEIKGRNFATAFRMHWLISGSLFRHLGTSTNSKTFKETKYISRKVQEVVYGICCEKNP